MLAVSEIPQYEEESTMSLLSSNLSDAYLKIKLAYNLKAKN